MIIAYYDEMPHMWLCMIYDYETFSVKAVHETPGKAFAAALALTAEYLDFSKIKNIHRYEGC